MISLSGIGIFEVPELDAGLEASVGVRAHQSKHRGRAGRLGINAVFVELAGQQRVGFAPRIGSVAVGVRLG